jgi:hypothetical protein
MKTIKELINMSKEERFLEIFYFVTEEIKTKSQLETVKQALTGEQNSIVTAYTEAFRISELCQKAYINMHQSACLIDMAKITK